jgi:hypothetical protein
MEGCKDIRFKECAVIELLCDEKITPHRQSCSYHFVKIGKMIETFKRSYTLARVHGDDDHKILLIYVFSVYFSSLRGKVGLKHNPDHTVNALLTTHSLPTGLFCFAYVTDVAPGST